MALTSSFTTTALAVLCYEIVSEVSVRNKDGVYNTNIKNPSANYFDIERKRYFVPNNEFTNAPSLSALEQIKKSMFSSEEWMVEIPQILNLTLGQGVYINDKIEKRGLFVAGHEYMIGSSGCFTKIKLKNYNYW